MFVSNKKGVGALAGVAQWTEPNGRWFDSWSGHMPGLGARFPVGGVT